jgi:hypothetical protein
MGIEGMFVLGHATCSPIPSADSYSFRSSEIRMLHQLHDE